MTDTRVRFAPSPTGYLHIGSARTALFNWLFARNSGGKFFLRIEDTDKERSKDEFLEEILSSLKWLGLNWDGELVYQSKRTAYYRELAEQLVKKDLAYYEDQAIRFRVPKTGKIVVRDLLHGDIEFDTALFEDLVIFKSDGSPTYNFAVVCDDADMKITHVIRGDDHIANTPKQLPLYEALGFTKPIFCHIPLILGEDRSRMSKRHGATSIREYREAGFLPETLVNYLSLLGWSPGNNQELMTTAEIVQKFTLKRVLKTGAIFSKDKLEWMNGQYLRKLEIPALAEKLKPYAVAKGYWPSAGHDEAWFVRLAGLLRERMSALSQFPDLASYFFEDTIQYSADARAELAKDERLKNVFVKYADCLATIEPFDFKAIEEKSRAFMTEQGLSGKEFIHPCRVALTGRTQSPGFFETVALIGRARAMERLRQAAAVI